MPRVQLSYPPKGINETRKIMAPKSYTNNDSWMRAARKAFTNTEGVCMIPDWPHYVQAITRATIVFEVLNSKTHERCAVVIDRTPD